MARTTTAVLVLSFFSCFSAAADTAAAEPVSTLNVADAADTLQGVTVVARKRSEDVQEVPSTVTVVSADAISNDHLDSAVDIAKYAPNANAWNNDGRDRPRYYIRGVGNGNVANNAVGAVGIYNDDIYLNSLALQGFPLFDVDRVEVLSGPQGTLWGKNSTAGAINYISREPSFDAGGYARVGLGDYSQKDVESAFGGSVLDDVLAARAALRYESFGGWASNTADGTPAGNYSDLGARFEVLGKMGDEADALLNLHLRRMRGSRTPYYASLQSKTAPLPPLEWRDVETTVDNPQQVDSDGASLKINWKVREGIQLTSLTALEEGERIESSDGDSTPLDINRTHGDTRPHQVSEELRIASTNNGPLTWLAGLYYLDETLQSYQVSVSPGTSATAVGFTDTGFRQTTRSEAAFGNLTWTIGSGVSLTAGVRETHDEAGMHLACGKALNPVQYTNTQDWWLAGEVTSPVIACWSAANPQNQSTSWSKFTFDIEPQWQVTDGSMLYTRVASGYRAGVYQGQVAPTTPPGLVNPETLVAYEGGYKSEWFGRRLTVNADVFDYDYKNIQVSVVEATPSGISAFLANAANGYSRGAELEFRALPVGGLNISGNVGLLRTRYLTFNVASLSGSLSGKEFARAPRTTATLAADYDWTLPRGHLTVGTDWHYNGHFYFLATDETSAALQQAGYTVGNVHVHYDVPGDRLELGLAALNVSETHYKVQVLPYQYQAYQYALGAPRTFLFTLTTRFH